MTPSVDTIACMDRSYLSDLDTMNSSEHGSFTTYLNEVERESGNVIYCVKVPYVSYEESPLQCLREMEDGHCHLSFDDLNIYVSGVCVADALAEFTIVLKDQYEFYQSLNHDEVIGPAITLRENFSKLSFE